ncbi:MAG: glycosyltransferase [Candidatus Omnitrophota bacterium]
MIVPLVSVIIPTFNGLSRGFLLEALESVLAQTCRDFELILVDDGSTDDIQAGCARFLKDPRIRIVRQENRGLSGARQAGIDVAGGKYIALLDDDDRWAPGKLAAQVAFLESRSDPQAGMVFCGVRLIDAKGNVIGARRKEASGNMRRRFVINGNGVTAPSAVLFKRSLVEKAGNFDPLMRSLEDLDMWLRVSRHTHIYSMPALLADYRLHGDTITAKNFSREEEYEAKLYERVIGEEPGVDPVLIRRNMFKRFGIRHMSLGNYRLAAEALARSLALRFSWEAALLRAACFLPPASLDGVKKIRQASRCKELS